MGIVHALDSFASGGLTGTQVVQRDWSPYLVHFTKWTAMNPLRSAVKDRLEPSMVQSDLRKADAESFKTVQLIAKSNQLMANVPGGKVKTTACVCFSECNLAGLVSHCERYGRFGFVLGKDDVFALGGGPCVYLRKEHYDIVRKFAGSAVANEQRLWSLANVYIPKASSGNKVQDYTHEREWRVFRNVEFGEGRLKCVLAPNSYVPQVMALFPSVPVVPIDMLYAWGA